MYWLQVSVNPFWPHISSFQELFLTTQWIDAPLCEEEDRPNLVLWMRCEDIPFVGDMLVCEARYCGLLQIHRAFHRLCEFKPVFVVGSFVDDCPMLGLECYAGKTSQMMKTLLRAQTRGKFIRWTFSHSRKTANSGGLNLDHFGLGVCEIWSPPTPIQRFLWVPMLERDCGLFGDTRNDIAKRHLPNQQIQKNANDIAQIFWSNIFKITGLPTFILVSSCDVTVQTLWLSLCFFNETLKRSYPHLIHFAIA